MNDEDYEVEVRVTIKKPKYFPNLKEKLYKDLTEQIGKILWFLSL